MENLDGKTIPIGDLFSQEFFFRVPEYQRPFSWDPDNFDDLIDDLITANKSQEYFLGTIVLHKKDKNGNYDIVDGQQRLTSIMILLACLRDIVKDEEFKKGVQAKILQPRNVVDGIEEKIRLEVKDITIFMEIVQKNGGTKKVPPRSTRSEPECRYIDAVNIFHSKLKDLPESEIQSIISFLSQKCVLIYLATSTFDDAFRLFTIVNDRGKQLRRIDIIKSINIAPDVVVKETIRNRIAQKWEEYEKELGESKFEDIFHLLRLIILKDKPQGDLLSEFEKRVFQKGSYRKGEPFIKLVFEYIELYKSIFEDRNITEELSEHNKFRALIHIMNTEFRASEWRACLLLYAKKFNSEKIYEFCLALEKAYLTQWIGGIRKDERYLMYSKVLGLIEDEKRPDEIIKKIEFDEDSIRSALGVANFYETGYCKYILLRLELVAAEHDSLRDFDAMSIEHILPQNPNTTGYWPKHHNISEIKDYVHMIGNLVLLSKSKNSSASNYDFAEKKERYLRKKVSDYPRSIQILSYDDWEKDTILKRTKEAQELILTDL